MGALERVTRRSEPNPANRSKSVEDKRTAAVVAALLYVGDAMVGVAHKLDEVQGTLSLIQQDAIYRGR